MTHKIKRGEIGWWWPKVQASICKTNEDGDVVYHMTNTANGTLWCLESRQERKFQKFSSQKKAHFFFFFYLHVMMNANSTYFTRYVSQVIMLYTLNLHHVVYFSKTEEKRKPTKFCLIKLNHDELVSLQQLFPQFKTLVKRNHHVWAQREGGHRRQAEQRGHGRN